jgi:hypothetical protein
MLSTVSTEARGGVAEIMFLCRTRISLRLASNLCIGSMGMATDQGGDLPEGINDRWWAERWLDGERSAGRNERGISGL